MVIFSRKIYIGSICNRDYELLHQLKQFCKLNYNVSIVNLLNSRNEFDPKTLKKKLKKYPISFIILKLLSDKRNKFLYSTLKAINPNISLLNSLNSVQICESRRNTFYLIEQRSRKLNIPCTFYSIDESTQALQKGIPIIVKLDVHNAPFIEKEDRIVGIARNVKEFQALISNFEERELFFQEYLGKFEKVHKVYIIDRWTVCITSPNRLLQNPSPKDLIHVREPIDPQLKRRILRLGKKLKMPIFGIDYILKDDVPYIVDVNDFPSFRHIPEAVSLISDYIYQVLSSRMLTQKTKATISGI